MVVLMSLPRVDLAGGPSTHLPLLRSGLEALGVRVIPFNYTRRKDVEARWRKAVDRGIDLLRAGYLTVRHRPHLIHHNSAFDAGTFVRDALLCVLAWLLRTPLLIKVHGSHVESFGRLSLVHTLARYLTLRLSTAVGVLSQPEVEEFRHAWPWLPNKVLVVRNVLRSDFLRAAVRSHSQPTVFFTSRFVAKKGIYDLLDAIPEIVRARPQVRFVFIGDGPESPAFLSQVAERGVSSYVQYFPHKRFNELIELYSEGGVFVFPTHFPEGMPMALMEAMAVGLCVISAPIRFARQLPSFKAHPELLLRGDEAFAPQIARVIIRCIDDVELRRGIGERNKVYASEYSQQSVALEFAHLYIRLVGARLS